MQSKRNCTLMAGQIIAALGMMFPPAWEMTVDEVLSKYIKPQRVKLLLQVALHELHKKGRHT